MVDPFDQTTVARALRQRAPQPLQETDGDEDDLRPAELLDYSPEQKADQADRARMAVAEGEQRLLNLFNPNQQQMPYFVGRTSALDSIRQRLFGSLMARRDASQHQEDYGAAPTAIAQK